MVRGLRLAVLGLGGSELVLLFAFIIPLMSLSRFRTEFLRSAGPVDLRLIVCLRSSLGYWGTGPPLIVILRSSEKI